MPTQISIGMCTNFLGLVLCLGLCERNIELGNCVNFYDLKMYMAVTQEVMEKKFQLFQKYFDVALGKGLHRLTI